MLIFSVVITCGWDHWDDEQGNEGETPIQRFVKLRASRDNLDVVLRGVRRIMENGLAQDCYVALKEDDGRGSYSGCLFDGEPSVYDELSRHRGHMLRMLELNNL